MTELPEYIKKNQNIFNPKSTNNMCFWNCLAYHETKNERCAKRGKDLYVNFYGDRVRENYEGVDFQYDIPEYERRNNIGINIFSLTPKINETAESDLPQKNKYEVENVRKSENEDNKINLLLHVDKESKINHFFYIPEIDKLQGIKYKCDSCGHCFSGSFDLKKHKPVCNPRKYDKKLMEETKNIRKAIANCKQSDTRKNIYNGKAKFDRAGNLTYEFVMELLQQQDYKCHLCNEIVFTHSYIPFCSYKFSIDRLDNNKPHDNDNIKISCYFCNCQDHYMFNKFEKEKCEIIDNVVCICNTVIENNISEKNENNISEENMHN